MLIATESSRLVKVRELYRVRTFLFTTVDREAWLSLSDFLAWFSSEVLSKMSALSSALAFRSLTTSQVYLVLWVILSALSHLALSRSLEISRSLICKSLIHSSVSQGEVSGKDRGPAL